MKTVVISVVIGAIMFFVGRGLAYNSLSRDLLDCRLALDQIAIHLSVKEEELEEYYLKEHEDNEEVLEE